MYGVKGQRLIGESKGKPVLLVFRKDTTQHEGNCGEVIELVGQGFSCHP